MCEEDIIALRQHGLDDRAIHDATQVIGYFNYINRVAEGLHVEQEDFIRPWEKSPYPSHGQRTTRKHAGCWKSNFRARRS